MMAKIIKGPILTVDKEKIPMKGVYPSDVQGKYPVEFKILNSLKVGQSATFPKERYSTIHAIRAKLEKFEKKRFTIKPADKETSRIWRLPDNTPKKPRTGGRKPGIPNTISKGLPIIPDQVNQS